MIQVAPTNVALLQLYYLRGSMKGKRRGKQNQPGNVRRVVCEAVIVPGCASNNQQLSVSGTARSRGGRQPNCNLERQCSDSLVCQIHFISKTKRLKTSPRHDAPFAAVTLEIWRCSEGWPSNEASVLFDSVPLWCVNTSRLRCHMRPWLCSSFNQDARFFAFERSRATESNCFVVVLYFHFALLINVNFVTCVEDEKNQAFHIPGMLFCVYCS